jgi:hypothetical protein
VGRASGSGLSSEVTGHDLLKLAGMEMWGRRSGFMGEGFPRDGGEQELCGLDGPSS